MLFVYTVTTSTGRGQGTIEATNDFQAKIALIKEFSHDEGANAQFLDAEGQPVEHKILSIALAEVI
jgi:hypothetical protein